MTLRFLIAPSLLLSVVLRLAADAPISSHGADTRYAPDWAGIAPKRVIKHTSASGDALVKAVAALQP